MVREVNTSWSSARGLEWAVALSAKCNRKPLGRFKAESGLSWGQSLGLLFGEGRMGSQGEMGKGKTS